MIEFEKWSDSVWKNMEEWDFAVAEAAWKAALEWILECLSPQDALEMIREELEIKT